MAFKAYFSDKMFFLITLGSICEVGPPISFNALKTIILKYVLLKYECI